MVPSVDLFFSDFKLLLTEAEVQTGALGDWGGGTSTGHSTGRDAAIFRGKKSNKGKMS